MLCRTGSRDKWIWIRDDVRVVYIHAVTRVDPAQRHVAPAVSHPRKPPTVAVRIRGPSRLRQGLSGSKQAQARQNLAFRLL